MATLENFEMLLIHEEMIYELVESLVGAGQVKAEKYLVSVRSAIGDNYVRMIVAGNRTFESVPERVKQEVADKLISMGREDLVTDPSYLPKLPEEVLPEPEEEQQEMPEGDSPTVLPEMDRPTTLPEVE